MIPGPAIVEQVDAVFADMAMPQHPGAALLVIDHGEMVYRKCYGLADIDAQQPITADSSFYLASISKQFTAMAVMLLVEQGKLSFADQLLTYFPRFPSWGAEITLRHMLHHTSGLQDYFSFFKPPNGGEMIVTFRDTRLLQRNALSLPCSVKLGGVDYSLRGHAR
jgi:CubicO group peptidase (beta-lactamase class C family)